MNYISYKRFKGTTIENKEVNIPALSECTGYKGLLAWEGNIICALHSECCPKYFIYNEDN